MSHRTVAPQGGPSVEVPNNLPGNFASVQCRWHEERQGEPRDWAMPNTLGGSRLMQHKEMYRTGDAGEDSMATKSVRPINGGATCCGLCW